MASKPEISKPQIKDLVLITFSGLVLGAFAVWSVRLVNAAL